MERALMIVFFIAMLLCGCSVETVFDGGAPVAIIALLVAIACAVVLLLFSTNADGLCK